MALRDKKEEFDLLESKLVLKFIAVAWIIFMIIFYLVSRPRPNVVPVSERSICFILGDDREGKNFYKLAEEFFREDLDEKTDKLVKHIRSLEELVEYLNTHESSQSFDRIEIVVHGNVWSGLSTKILDGGERAYPKELLKAVVRKELPTLDEGIIHPMTVVNIWGCGIGKNPLLSIALDSIFTDENGTQPRVNASDDFVIFKRIHPDLPAKKIQANYWPYFFKRGYRPSESEIIYAFNKKYPEESLQWELALRNEDSFDENIYEESFHIPISWTVIYKNRSDRPDVGTLASKMNWIKSQPRLMKRINEMGIPIEKYNWTVNKIIHTNEQGEKVPAIKAIGMSTVLCVLQDQES